MILILCVTNLHTFQVSWKDAVIKVMGQQVVLKPWGGAVASGPLDGCASSDVIVGCARSVTPVDISSSAVDFSLADYQVISNARNRRVINEVLTRIDRQLDLNKNFADAQLDKKDPKRKREPEN